MGTYLFALMIGGIHLDVKDQILADVFCKICPALRFDKVGRKGECYFRNDFIQMRQTFLQIISMSGFLFNAEQNSLML